jgi:uncharacterized protein (DUF924 family)
MAMRGEYEWWLESSHGALALVVLLDQFSRNIFRGKPKCWSQDKKALEICLKCIESGSDRRNM